MDNITLHVCDEIVRDGDWIIYKCSKCPEYEHRINWRTGEMKRFKDDFYIFHQGTHFPIEYETAFTNLN